MLVGNSFFWDDRYRSAYASECFRACLCGSTSTGCGRGLHGVGEAISRAMGLLRHHNQERDRGAGSDAIGRVMEQTKGEVPGGAIVQVQGQALTTKSAYLQLLVGLAFSVLLVYP